MIKLKSLREAELMRRAGKIAAAARALAGDMATVGVTTRQIDTAVREFIISQGAIPTFQGYNGFPASICASVNEQVIHGIPDDRPLRDGDLISIDVGATKDGYVGDCAGTFIVGKGTEEMRRLIAVTKQSFFEGMKFAREGYRISDISHAIQQYVEQNGFSVVREYVGHGIGAQMHEPPEVPNFGSPGRGARLVRGMTLAVEPMVNAGGPAINVLSDGWTVVTLDGSLSAHYENTILVTDGEPEILTTAEGKTSGGGLR
jgi:methionyl aminopeptidase